MLRCKKTLRWICRGLNRCPCNNSDDVFSRVANAALGEGKVTTIYLPKPFSVTLLSDNPHGFIRVPSPRYRRFVPYTYYYLRYRDRERARLCRKNYTLLPESTFQMSCLRHGQISTCM